jgi:hypothetical protein
MASDKPKKECPIDISVTYKVKNALGKNQKILSLQY